MKPLTAKVHQGRLQVDSPTDLPEGTEVELIAIDAWDGLDDDERKRLHRALRRSEEDVRASRVRPMSDILDDLDCL